MLNQNAVLLNVPSQLGAGFGKLQGREWSERADAVGAALSSLGIHLAKIQTLHVPAPSFAGNSKLHYLNEVVEVCQRVSSWVRHAREEGNFPIILGGDHSLAVGSASGMATALKTENKSLSLLWMDAHADMNTIATTPSGNIHGMALNALIDNEPIQLSQLDKWDHKILPKNVTLLGLRFADEGELDNIQKSGINVISASMLAQSGIIDALGPVLASSQQPLHLSFDLDCINPAEAPAVNTPYPGGLTFREARLACEMAADSARLVSLDIVEHNPQKGSHEEMIAIISELIAACLGHKALFIPNSSSAGKPRAPSNQVSSGKSTAPRRK
jgi:arginase